MCFFEFFNTNYFLLQKMNLITESFTQKMMRIIFFYLLLAILDSKLIRIPLEYQSLNLAKIIFTHRNINKYFPMQKLPLKDFKKVQYIGEINIGSKNRQFKMIFDTGSTLMWVPAKNCSSCYNSGIIMII